MVRRAWDLWRFLGGAIAALLLAASQLDPNPLPAWVLVITGVLALLSVALAFLLERSR
ncbi:MAG TPA: hypothetical protein VFB73_13810 [Chloroflexota bacterium]|nr:hypothetical protein [Chloroflexota bacterium]